MKKTLWGTLCPCLSISRCVDGPWVSFPGFVSQQTLQISSGSVLHKILMLAVQKLLLYLGYCPE